MTRAEGPQNARLDTPDRLREEPLRHARRRHQRITRRDPEPGHRPQVHVRAQSRVIDRGVGAGDVGVGGCEREQRVLLLLAPQLVDHVLPVAGGDRRDCGPGDAGLVCNVGVCHLALGQIDIVCESGLKLHDFAALAPIVEGAGGRLCDWNGDPLTAASEGHVLALGDPARTDDVLEALRSAPHPH